MWSRVGILAYLNMRSGPNGKSEILVLRRSWSKIFSNWLIFWTLWNQSNPSPTTCVVPPLPVGRGFSVHWFHLPNWSFQRESVLSYFAFSWGRRWPKAGWGSSCKYLIFLTFLSSDQIPHPPLAWSPLSQLGEGFLSFSVYSIFKKYYLL